MKKAIIILTLLSIVTISFSIYEGFKYILSLNSLQSASTTKNELVDKNMILEEENTKLENEYSQKFQDLLNDNIGCALWRNQEEVLKKIKE